MSFFEYFDLTCIINLPERSDRRDEMNDQLSQIGELVGERGIQFIDAVRPDSKAGFPTVGAHGCFQSHLKCLRTAIEQDCERLLIIEDDLNFSSDFFGSCNSVCPRAIRINMGYVFSRL